MTRNPTIFDNPLPHNLVPETRHFTLNKRLFLEIVINQILNSIALQLTNNTLRPPHPLYFVTFI